MKFLTSTLPDGEPYEGDFFENRRQYGENLKKFISTVEDGCVLAIDAKWGEGKTTFAKWWAKDLKKEHVPVYFDAFKHDFNSEPFWAITKVLFEQFPEDPDPKKNISAMLEKLKGQIIPDLLSFTTFVVASAAFSQNGLPESGIAGAGATACAGFVKKILKKSDKKTLE